MTQIDDRLEKAMRELSSLSGEAKAAGEDQLMYAINRAWHELFNEGCKRISSKLKRA